MTLSTLRLSSLLLVLVSHGLSAFGRGAGSQAEATLSWHSDADAAFVEARETGRPLLAVFR
jgi:hypothetical protein